MRLLRRALLALAALTAMVYACDYAILRYRITRSRDAFGTVAVQKFYAIKEKTGKTELSTSDPKDVTCANSLFPHFGYTPCWYLRRHTEQQVNI